ncbi:MAG: hypothetical protein Q4A05_02365 [Ruminococcus sp.]|nr:hypothetical protein [Ruminococcus sp.]
MLIVEMIRTGYDSECKTVTTERGTVIIEDLTPAAPDSSSLKAAEARLYEVFSRYGKQSDRS